MREAAFDVASMAKTSTKVFVLEVMGRHAGWITAAVGLADDAGTPIPLLLLFPEIAFDEANSSRAVEAKVERFGYCCVGVSEGLHECGRQAAGRGGHASDAFGHAQLGGVGPMIATLVKDKLGLQDTTGRSPTTCSARRATSRRRPTSSRRTRSARRRSSCAAAARTR